MNSMAWSELRLWLDVRVNIANMRMSNGQEIQRVVNWLHRWSCQVNALGFVNSFNCRWVESTVGSLEPDVRLVVAVSQMICRPSIITGSMDVIKVAIWKFVFSVSVNWLRLCLIRLVDAVSQRSFRPSIISDPVNVVNWLRL